VAALAPSEHLLNQPGLYVHVPFCSAICNYCNFNRGLLDEALKERYVGALIGEIRQAAVDSPIPDTLYFGGGTPSLLSPGQVGSIIDECRRRCRLDPQAEVTLEANPETVDARALEGFREAGVNRLSFGVQSFREDELRRLGRLHSPGRARQVFADARAAGFDDISIDLMMSLPGQNVAEWLESVGEAALIAPDHLSLYILEVYPHLPLKQDIDRHGWSQPADDAAAEMYERGLAMLDDAGYLQYEISNVCRPGHQSAHNLKYWTDGDWWGFGPGAHSTWQGARWRNVAATTDYIERIAAAKPVAVDCRALSSEERLGDALFTGLRLTAGIDLRILSARYGADVWQRFGGRLEPFCEAGILLKQEDCLRLTRPGMLLASEVMSVFV
jgi:oxygen-independent coproporphyrinogen-3 oxidase